MEYRREVDGLRAIAVVPVILYHAGYSFFKGGYVGVDVFFVISGYLITSIIISEKSAGVFTLANFYERRARRILPALYAVMLLCIPAAWILLLPHDIKSFSQSLVAVSTYASNILFWQTSGYFDAASELKPLLHTWSLAIEEQYYALFPIFLMVTWGLGKRKIIFILIMAAVVSLVLADMFVSLYANSVFYLLPTRGWELLIGSFVAFLIPEKHRWECRPLIDNIGGIIGFMLILVSIFAFDDQVPFPSFYTLIPTVGTALILVCATEQTAVGKLLGTKVVVGVGLISYSAYLLHQPIFAFARHKCVSEPGKLLMLLLVGFTLFFAFVSWRYVEQPFRQKKLFGRKFIFIFSAVGGAFFIAIGLAGHFQNGFKEYYYSTRLSENELRVAKLVEESTSYNLYDFMFDDGACRFWGDEITPKIAERFKLCSHKFNKALIVLGDSHGMNLYNIIAKSGVYPFVLGVSQGYCRITDIKDFCQYNSFDQFLRDNPKNISMVIYHQTGNPFIVNAKGDKKFSNKYSGKYKLDVDVSQISVVLDYLNLRSGELVKLAWVGPWVEPRIRVDYMLDKKTEMNSYVLSMFEILDQTIKSEITRRKNNSVKYFSLIDEFGFGANALWNEDCLMYKDKNHLSRCGEDYLAVSHKEFWKSLLDQK